METHKEHINILIADDHQMFIDGIKSITKNEEDITIAAEALNGKEAMGYLIAEDINFVIADIEMPEMNGIELTEWIKENKPDVKVLIVTNYKDRGFIDAMIKAEAEGYILKNTGKQELLNAINRIADGGTFYSNEVVSILMENYKEKEKAEEQTKDLSLREKEIVRLICQENSTNEIADKLFLSPYTVETHRKNILKKKKAKTIVGLIKYAIENKLT